MTARPSRILLDTNIWLDNYLPFRAGSDAARTLIDVAWNEGIDLLYAASTARDVFYMVARTFKWATVAEKGGLSEGDALAIRDIAWACVDNMRDLGSAVGADESDLWLACKYRRLNGDLEDNMILAAMERSGADYLVTSDEGLLRRAPFATLSASDMVVYLSDCVGGGA